MHLTPRQQYDKCLEVFRAWVNWEGEETFPGGLLAGLGDYYVEITLLEEELDIPVAERFKLSDYKKW